MVHGLVVISRQFELLRNIGLPFVAHDRGTLFDMAPENVEKRFSCSILHRLKEYVASFAADAPKHPLLGKNASAVIFSAREKAFIDLNGQS